MATGRFAPSPTGALHVGNLRTALVAWLFARSAGSPFLLRVEDLAARPDAREVEAGQRADLRSLGLDWDGPVLRQSERRAVHDAAIDGLTARGLTYPCWCTRREVAEAAEAPHGQPPGAYPGTCRDLSAAARAELEASGRPAALRLRSTGERVTIVDRLHGEVTAAVDDLVLRRNDGEPAYNLAVVVDDADQGVEEVVRGDDLLSSTPRQAHLADLLGRPRPAWAHVPLVLGPDGERLAKRHGAIALPALTAAGVGVPEVLSQMAGSLGLAAPGELVTADQLVARFDPAAVPLAPWTFLRPGVGPDGAS